MLDDAGIRAFFEVKCSLGESVAKLTSVAMLSFRQVAHPYVREFISLRHKNAPSSHTTVSSKLADFCKDIQVEMIKTFNDLKAQMKLSVVFDEWTSFRKRRYMNVFVIATEKSFNLGLIRISGRADANNLLNLLKERLLEYDLNLEKDVSAIITDGASVMRKIGKLIDPVYQQLCIAHCIQLAIVKTLYNIENKVLALEETDTHSVYSNLSESSGFFLYPSDDDETLALKADYGITISKIRDIVSMFHRSPTKNDVLQTHVVKEFGHELQLVKDVETRWSSLCDMLQRFYKLFNCIKNALTELKKPFEFEPVDMFVLKEINFALRFVKLTVEKLCQDNITLEECDNLISTLFDVLQKQASNLIQPLVANIKIEYQKRRTILTDCMFYFSCHTGNLEMHKHLDTIPPTKHQLTQAFVKLSSSFVKPPEPNQAEQPADLPDVIENEEDFLRILEHKRRSKHKQPVSEEFSSVHEEMQTFEASGCKGPILNFVYSTLLSIRPTSVQSERAFSVSNLFCCKLRTKLEDKTLDRLVVSRYFLIQRDNVEKLV